MWRRILSSVATILIILTSLSSFALAEGTIKKGTIKIGVYLPMTGYLAPYGRMEWFGLQIAHEMRSEVLGKGIDLVLEDSKSNKIEAAGAVLRLIEKKKVVGIIGGATSGDTLAGNALSEVARIPSISPTATNPLVTQGKEYAFRACFIDPFQGLVAARFAYERIHARTAAVIVDISRDYSVGLANFFTREFIRLGGKITSTAYIRTGDKDFSTQLSAIKVSNPDIIYSPNYYTEDAFIAKQARGLGINVPILSGDGAQAYELIEIGGKAVENMYFTSHFHKDAATTELAKEYIKLFHKKGGKDVDAFGALAADAYFLMVEAIHRAGSISGPRVRRALANIRGFPGVSGIITMQENGNPIKSVVVSQIKDGKFKYVATLSPPGVPASNS